MRQFDIVSLKLFAAIVREGNIARAARLSNIAPSAVSKRLSQLERQLGATLLVRRREGIEITQEGRILYEHVMKLDDVLACMQQKLGDYADRVSGTVKIWANTSAITQFLPEDIAEFLKVHPTVKIELREDVSNRIVDAVKSGDADIGVISDHIAIEGLETSVYRRDTLMVVAPSNHPLDLNRPARFTDLLGFDYVGLQQGSSLQERLLVEAERLGHRMRIRVQSFGFEGVRRMVEAGLGIAILPKGAVLPFLAAEPIKAFDLDEPWSNRNLLLAYRSYDTLPTAAKAFVSSLLGS